MVLNEYKGSDLIAIVKLRNNHYCRLGLDSHNLEEKLNSESYSFGEAYQVLRVYIGVNYDSCMELLDKVLNDLNSGKNVELKGLFS